MIDLVILDLFGTIKGRTLRAPREGVRRFFDRNKEKRFALATDADAGSAHYFLGQLRLRSRFERIYTCETIVDGYEGEGNKDIGLICREMGVNVNKAVYIADTERDQEAAQAARVRFIHVPEYQSRKDRFSFDVIDITSKLPPYLDLREAPETDK